MVPRNRCGAGPTPARRRPSVTSVVLLEKCFCFFRLCLLFGWIAPFRGKKRVAGTLVRVRVRVRVRGVILMTMRRMLPQNSRGAPVFF